MKVTGVGPRLLLATGAFFCVMLALHIWQRHLFGMHFLPRWLTVAVGVALLVLGIPLWAWGIARVVRGFKAGVLVTDGPYAIMRHPVYSAGIVFITPAIAFLVNSWLLLAVPVFMYVFFRILIIREERWLEQTFGRQYLDYKRRVHLVLPTLSRKMFLVVLVIVAGSGTLGL